MGDTTREWLKQSIKAGSSTDARLRLKGDLKDFPVHRSVEGQFQVVARVTGGELEYASGWPGIAQIDADLLFERNRMEITGRSGTILGTKIQNVKVAIADLWDPLLTVNGNAEGPTAEFFKFIQQSPVRKMIDGVTDPMSATGNGKLALKLDLPLRDLPKSKVAGEYQFSGNTTVVDLRLPAIEKASGRVSFTENGFTVHEARGQLFGGPIAVSGGTGEGGGIAITARGDATVAGIGAVFDHPWRARLSGGAPYTASVAIKGGRTQITFESPLRGVASDLPPPLAKAAATEAPLRIDIFPAGDRDRISVSIAKVVTAEFLRVRQGNEMQTQRTGVSLTPDFRRGGSCSRAPGNHGLRVASRARPRQVGPAFPRRRRRRRRDRPGERRESRSEARHARRARQAADRRRAARGDRFGRRMVGEPEGGRARGRAELPPDGIGPAGRAAFAPAHSRTIRPAPRRRAKERRSCRRSTSSPKRSPTRKSASGASNSPRNTTARTGASSAWSS
jgi:hypothetical protein